MFGDKTFTGHFVRGFVSTQFALIVLLGAIAAAAVIPPDEPTVEELKARLAAANTGDKVHFCVQLAEKRLSDADKLYVADDIDKAQGALGDVVSYSELARDYSIESRKHQKQTEIAMRAMTRKLTAILHVLGHDDQGPVQDAIKRLERVRDDLLASMFPKGVQ